MNANNEFDRIAREKAGERQLPFAEADWTAMQQLLEQEHHRRGLGWWWALAAAVLLGIGGGAWLLSTGGDRTAQVQSSVEKTSTDPLPAGLATSQPSSNDPSATTTSTPVAKDDQTMQEKARETFTTAPVARTPMSIQPTGKSGQKTIPPATTPTAQPVEIRSVASETSVANAPSESAETPEVAPFHVVTKQPAASMPDPPESPEQPTSTGTEGSVEAETLAATVPGPTGDTAHLEQTTTMNLTQVPDSAPPAEAAVVPKKYFDELVLSVGALRTRTTYSGGGSDQWTPTISEAWTPSLGLEWMRQYDRFGYGTGLNHSTYSERVFQQEAYTTSLQYNYLHSFLQVDTNVTVVVDTVVQGGLVFYVTEQVPTSLMVLETTVDTMINTTQTQEAVDQFNRVSYLEVPLLGEIHWTTGHWRLSIQAGPFAGFLTSQRGSLPYGPDGSIDLADQPLRSVMFGYTARAYVRWLSGDRFSFGLAPGIRGQFGNAYSEGELSRTSMGFGGAFQVAYHLR